VFCCSGRFVKAFVVIRSRTTAAIIDRMGMDFLSILLPPEKGI